MLSWYNVLKFVHVTAVIVWVGGVVVLGVVGERLAKEPNGAALRVLGAESELFGRSIQGPAVGLALLSGLAMMGLVRAAHFWMVWGLVALVVSMALDGAVVRRASRQVVELASAESPDETRLAAVRQRLRVGTWINVLILVSTVFVMVVKPTLG